MKVAGRVEMFPGRRYSPALVLSAQPLFDTPLRGFALLPDQTSRNSGTLENYHCRTRPSSLKLAKDYSASGASNGLMVGAKRKGPAAPMRCGAHCDTRSINITRSRTGIAEAAERLNTRQKCEGATGSLAIVASSHGPSQPPPRIAIANDVSPRGRKFGFGLSGSRSSSRCTTDTHRGKPLAVDCLSACRRCR